VIRARGNKGELRAVLLARDPSRFQSLSTVYVDGTPYELERVWYHKEQPVLKLRGVDSISEAERLAGKDVSIPAEQRLALPDGEYYFSDLVGCRMVEDASGTPVGIVTGWQETGESVNNRPVLLEVDDGRGPEPLLIPFAGSMLKKIDVAAREIRTELPAGLLELNR
jgi:16S rRNA processing protein RimM